MGGGWSHPDWQPSKGEISRVSLIGRKEIIIPQLSETHYKYNYGNVTIPSPITVSIPAFDESNSLSLVASLKHTDTTSISSGQVDAFSRLVLQEETLAKTLIDFSDLSNDQADILADMTEMTGGVFLLTAKLPGALENPKRLKIMQDIARKISQDIVYTFLMGISDPKTRDQVLDSYSLLWDYVEFRADPLTAGVNLAKFHIDEYLRASIAKKNISRLTSVVQPTIDQGVNSVNLQGQDIWAVNGTYEMADIQMSHITVVSTANKDFAQTYTWNYQNKESILRF